MPTRSYLFTAVALAIVASALAPPASAQPRARNVLTIHSGPADYTANPVLDAAIREALLSQPGQPIDYFVEYLEFDRFPEVEASLALRDYIRRKYAGRRIDLVIAVTNRSVQFVMENRQDLFPGASIVFAALGVPRNDLVRDAGPGITGVRVGNNFTESLKLALALHPGTRQVFVVAISPNRENVESVQTELRPFARQVRLTYIDADTISQLRTAVAAVPRGSLILYIWYMEAGPGYVLDPQAPARVVAETARVPVYGVIDSNVGTGIVGGMVRDTRRTGARAGAIARQILDGTPAQDIPIENAPLVPMFDWRQLKRWGLDPARLPSASELRFRVPTVWEGYRRYFIAAFVIMIGQLLLIAGLLTQRARRQRAERTLLSREATLRASYVRIRQLAGRLIHAQEAARADIARDLHDDVCQDLVGVSMTVSSLKRLTGSMQDARTQRTLSQLERSALDTVESIRRLSHDLHPASLRLLGLASALKGYCLEVEKRHAVIVNFTSTSALPRLAPDVAVCLFRIAQEALRNGVGHGAARRLRVSLGVTDEQVELHVTDDGRGFDLEAVRRDGSGLGLVSIEERARVVGGTAHIVTRLQQGTTVTVRVPIVTPAQAETDDAPVVNDTWSIGARLNRAVHVFKGELHRATKLVESSRRLAAGSADDGTASIAVCEAGTSAPQSRGPS